ncbi:hypothetical protein C455_01302 [Haloferax larsenii JCM 13917]|nr:hypothetical protein [Haloferax larsenii]ELZ84297.1 hypothetical protein C455_01302 [Haloferax larsenii JCM 13917]
MNHSRSVTVARDTIVATAVLAGLYGLAFGVQIPPFQIPGYLLIVGFDLLEVVFGPVQRHFDLVFGAYLVGLGVVGAAVAQLLRFGSRRTDVPQWRLAVASALALVGVLSFLFAASVLITTTQTTPVLITGAVGLTLIALAGWVSGLLRVELGPRQ